MKTSRFMPFMRFFLWLVCLVLLARVGIGVHLVLEQARKMSSYSIRTTAIILEKRLNVHVTKNDFRPADRGVSYEPVVVFQYEAQGHQYTSDGVFPDTLRERGTFSIFAKVLLERFKVGEETSAYYNPDDPSEACLIRRPSVVPYFLMLLPLTVVCGLIAFLWRPSRPGNTGFTRWKGGWIAVLWHSVGLAGTGHYFDLAGVEYGSGAVVLFGVYTQLGLIPIAFALPPSSSSEFAGRIHMGIFGSYLGTFIGVCIGTVVGFVAAVLLSASATFFAQCLGYGIAISVTLLTLYGLMTGEREPKKRKRKVRTVRTAPKAESFVSVPPDGPIPFQIDQRPMPNSEELELLLPAQIGPFRRAPMDDPDEMLNAQIYAEYRSEGAGAFSDHGRISVELGVCDDQETAWMGVETTKAESYADSGEAGLFSLRTEPSFFMVTTGRGAFMSWTRGNYFFSALARGGDEDLNQFMEAFPY